ncbi:hypothetical protein B0H19DRAFT_1190196 [Mycena capillaripes]|nr:hypothetical protein B0H19DRAFT_1190196 [Mycena capillaripes]
MPRASSSSESPRKKRQDPATPSKAKTVSPGIQKRRKEWKESLPPLWIKQATFRHPSGTTTVTKTDAAKKFKLDPREIGTLPHEQRLGDAGFVMQLYNQSQLMELAKRKCAKLELKLEIGDLVYHSQSGSSASGSVSTVSWKNPPRLANWPEHMLNPQPLPLKLPDGYYSCPPQAEKPDPEGITWTPSKIVGAVTVDDACRLYCITPEDIRDLTERSPWIDLASAAKRALTLHGGFYAHKELVYRHRREEEKILEPETHGIYTVKSHFRFSSMIQIQWEGESRVGVSTYVTGERPKHPVAVLYPIEYVDQGDYGCEWEWMPFWGDF